MARRKRTKRNNPAGLAGLGVLPLIIPAATAAAALIPVVAGLFKSEPETPAFHFDPNKYSQDYAMVLAAKTQEALAQHQTQQKAIEAQAVVQAEQIQSDSTKKLVLYGALGVAGIIGVLILIKSFRGGK